MSLLYILAGVVGLFAVLAVVVARQANEFRIERSATMAASPRTVFDQVNDFHNWEAWSPWAKVDPNMTLTISTPPAGVGATYAWKGNKQAGEGIMTILDSRPGELVGIDLNFLKPFACHNRAEFTFTPTVGGTTVRWAMTGHKNFLFKAVHLLMNVDKLVGRDFEKGLAAMRAVVEQPPVRAAA